MELVDQEATHMDSQDIPGLTSIIKILLGLLVLPMDMLDTEVQVDLTNIHLMLALTA
jgi:hypothetical protein